MNDDLVQAYAGLTMQEFALEVLYANWLAQMPQAEAERILQVLIDSLRYSMHVPSDATVDEKCAFGVQKDAAARMERFANRVRESTDKIRATRSRNDANSKRMEVCNGS